MMGRLLAFVCVFGWVSVANAQCGPYGVSGGPSFFASVPELDGMYFVWVTTTKDVADPTPNDAVCGGTTAGAGTACCSLRAAVQTANSFCKDGNTNGCEQFFIAMTPLPSGPIFPLTIPNANSGGVYTEEDNALTGDLDLRAKDTWIVGFPKQGVPPVINAAPLRAPNLLLGSNPATIAPIAPGSQGDRVFTLWGGNALFASIIIEGGQPSGNDPKGYLGLGGNILVAPSGPKPATLFMTQTWVLFGNAKYEGGGVYVAPNTTLVMDNDTTQYPPDNSQLWFTYLDKWLNLIDASNTKLGAPDYFAGNVAGNLGGGISNHGVVRGDYLTMQTNRIVNWWTLPPDLDRIPQTLLNAYRAVGYDWATNTTTYNNLRPGMAQIQQLPAGSTLEAGGAIYTAKNCETTLVDAQFSGNLASLNSSFGNSVTQDNTTFTPHPQSLGNGGALFNDAGSKVRVRDCGFTANQANGGHECTCKAAPVGTTVKSCSWSCARVPAPSSPSDTNYGLFGYGGAIFNNNADTEVRNSSFGMNIAELCGGAVLTSQTTKPVLINNVTMSQNESYNTFETWSPAERRYAKTGSGLGGALCDTTSSKNAGRVKVANTLIGKNYTHGFSGPTPATGASDCFGPQLASLDYNLVENDDSAVCKLDAAHDRFNLDTKLGAMALNGFDTWHFSFTGSSPAINRGNPGSPTDDDTSGLCERYDQRRLDLKADGAEPQVDRATNTPCDIGAIEDAGVEITKVARCVGTTVTPAGPRQPIVCAAGAGEGIQFDITASNGAPAGTASVTFSDTAPSGLQFTSAGNPCSVTSATTVGCPAIDVPHNQSRTITVGATCPEGRYRNVASGRVANGAPTSGSVVFSCIDTSKTARLVTTKTVDKAEVNTDETLTYTVTVRNEGPDSATQPQMIDTLPEGLLWQSLTVPSGWTCTPEVPVPPTAAGAVVTCDSSDPLAVSATAEFVFAVQTTRNGQFINTATASSLRNNDQPDGATSTATTTVSRTTHLTLTKSGPGAGVVGTAYDYSFAVNNSGPRDANNVIITDTLPAGLTPGTLPEECTADALTVTCVIGALAVGEEKVVAFQVLPGMAGAITNTATVGADEVNSVPDDGSSSVTTEIAAADTGPTVGDGQDVNMEGGLGTRDSLTGGGCACGTTGSGGGLAVLLLLAFALPRCASRQVRAKLKNEPRFPWPFS